MTILWSHLVNSKVHRNVKPQILSVFGDIALQIGNQFEPYVADTFNVWRPLKCLTRLAKARNLFL